MEMITAQDFYYLPRVKNLQKELKKVQDKKLELKTNFNHQIHFETGDCINLNLIADKIKTVEDLEQALETQIDELTSATLN